MKLLDPTNPSELPEEALLARLRCRRSEINLDTGPEVEVYADDVLPWVYQRLNRRLRERLKPFLELLAMRNLILALRYIMAGEMPPASMMQKSLLADELQKVLKRSTECEITLARLEASLNGDYPFVHGLTITYRNQGPGGVELQLADGILQHGLAKAGNGIVKKSLRYLIDMRNCLTIQKLWRWQVHQAPRLTSGGSISGSILQRIWATEDSDRLAIVCSRLAGRPLSLLEPLKMEQGLLNGMTKFLQRAGRDPLGLAVIIEYLWRAQLEVHNQLLQRTLAPKREELLEEVLLL